MERKDIRLLICKDINEIAVASARIFAEEIRRNPAIILGLATGSTPVGMYNELIRLHKEDGLDFSGVISFNLDEYLGLAPDHRQSYRYFMDNNLFNHINIDKSNTHILDGLSRHPERVCREFEEDINKAGGIDLQLLGIGGNGHIAFNEPGCGLDSRTGIVNLTEKTIKDNGRFFENASDVPRQALTMGIATILEAKKIVLLAVGEAKAVAVAEAVKGSVSSKVPASYLQYHSDCTFIIDEEAAQKLCGRNVIQTLSQCSCLIYQAQKGDLYVLSL